MKNNNFRNIINKMKKEFGTIRTGTESLYLQTLFKFEKEFLTLKIMNPSIKGSAVEDAICLALYKIKERIDGTQTDVQEYETKETLGIRDIILQKCDPFTNKDITAEVAKDNLDLSSKTGRKGYFMEDVKCLVRIYDSIAFWQEKYGEDGYFVFLRKVMDPILSVRHT